MAKTKKFSQLTDAARRDPIRRTRIDAARKRAAQESRNTGSRSCDRRWV